MTCSIETRVHSLPYRWLEFEWQESRYRVGLNRTTWKIQQSVLLPLFGPGGCDSGEVDPLTWNDYSPTQSHPAFLLEAALLTVEQSNDQSIFYTRHSAWRSLQDRTLTALEHITDDENTTAP